MEMIELGVAMTLTFQPLRNRRGITRALDASADAQTAEATLPPAPNCPKLALQILYHGPAGLRNRGSPLQGLLPTRLNPLPMFLEAFGLGRDPFLDTADPAFYYDTLPGAYGRRRLAECLAAGRGLAVVVGPIGAGKTTLFNAIQQELLSDDRFLVGVILDPTFVDEADLLVGIADCFGFAVDAQAPARTIKDALKRSLFEASQRARQPILFIDEAQLLAPALLEPLRALLNYQLDDRKLLSIALSGQMEFAGHLALRPNLSDRIALWLELRPLRESESAGLLHHRLRCAGYAADRSPFADDALRALWRESGGIPRRLTTLARESMEVAAERSRREVRLSDVEDAARRIVPSSWNAAGAASSFAPPARRWWQWWRKAS